VQQQQDKSLFARERACRSINQEIDWCCALVGGTKKTSTPLSRKWSRLLYFYPG